MCGVRLSVNFFDFHVTSFMELTNHIKTLEFENQGELKPIIEILIHVYIVDKYWCSILHRIEADIVFTTLKRPDLAGLACPRIDEYNVLISEKEKDALFT